MKKYPFFLLLLLFPILSSAQDIKVESTIQNPSGIINDGTVSLKVTGGLPPYVYKWSSQNTPLNSPRAENMVEGVPYTVVITDAAGNSVTKIYTVPAKAMTEHFNGSFAPIVQNMGAILFWDPFSAMGIYDPAIYADQKFVGPPSWTATTNSKYVLKKWMKPEGAHVLKGDLIAQITVDGEEREIFANADGQLKHLLAENKEIFNPNNKNHLIEEESQYFAAIKYDEPIILTHPNGDPQLKTIPFIVVWLILGALFFTLRMGFINFRGFRQAIRLASGKFDDPSAPGEVTH